MRPVRLLDGENIAPRTAEQARRLVGCAVVYLTRADIDHSGRGYFLPRPGTVDAVHRGHLEINGDFIAMRDIVEMVRAEPRPC